MRVGGLATGMDIEGMVNKLMEAERIPLNKLEQDRTILTWQRDAFRDLNRSLLELDELMLDMKLSKTYQSKSVKSSQEGAVTATGSANTPDGSYSIGVTQLATNAMYGGGKQVDLNAPVTGGEIKFSTYDVDTGKMKEYKVEGDTIKDVLKAINDDKDNNVRAFQDPQSGKIIMETTRTGKYNPGTPADPLADPPVAAIPGNEIIFKVDPGTGKVHDFFAQVGLVDENNAPVLQHGGTDAKFTYNGLELESKTNSYELNGLKLQFNSLTTEGTPAKLTVSNDNDHTFDSIMKFVDKYNEVIGKLNESQQEERYRDFKPLSTEEKKAMSDDEVKQWEEKAQSALLRGESSITNGLSSMRQGWYSNITTGGAFTSLTQIGITTSSSYMDGGKLIIDEDKLKTAIADNSADVQKLFANSADGNERGLVNRLEDSVKATMENIEKRAGKSTQTLDNYTLGKRMKQLNDRITTFEARMVKVETRHWNQFTQMEKAIQRMNDQSSQLFSQFG